MDDTADEESPGVCVEEEVGVAEEASSLARGTTLRASWVSPKLKLVAKMM